MNNFNTVRVEPFDSAFHPFGLSVARRSRRVNGYALDELRGAESKHEHPLVSVRHFDSAQRAKFILSLSKGSVRTDS